MILVGKTDFMVQPLQRVVGPFSLRASRMWKRISRIYTFAGITVKASYRYEETGRYLSKYESAGKPKFRLKVSDRDIVWEEQKSISEGMDYGNARWLYEAMNILRKFSVMAVDEGVLLFHASAVMVEGEAYLFAAPSGTGKSTHARLWRKVLGEKVTVINDDKPFLKRAGGAWYAYGSPWNGKHRLGNAIKAPVKAICFLEQGAENEIGRIGAEEGFPRLCKQVYFPERRAQCERVVQLTGELSQLPMYKMKCTVSEEAAKMSYRTLKGAEK